jgi:hypothetical protein
MKKFLLGAAAVIGLGLISVPQASAHWEVRTAYRWRPLAQVYVAYPRRVWVPDAVVVAPPPVVVVRTPAPIIVPRVTLYARPATVIIRP